MHKGLKFIFGNVRSLFNEIDSLTCELLTLVPDVLNISENWLQNELPDHLVSIPIITLYDQTGLSHTMMALLNVEEVYVHILNKV